MDPSSKSSENGFNLPPPAVEQIPQSPSESSVQAPERALAPPEQAPQRGQQAPAAIPTLPLPIPSMPDPAITQPDVSTTSNSGMPGIDDDGDLIEKEWVTKAKQIVERTRDNPYQQSEELTGVRADYMKKRYNKSIKLSK